MLSVAATLSATAFAQTAQPADAASGPDAGVDGGEVPLPWGDGGVRQPASPAALPASSDGGTTSAPAPEAGSEAGSTARPATSGRSYSSVVTGSGPITELRRSSAAVTVIDTAQARKETADLGEVLARTEGVGVQRQSGLGSSTRLSLSGFTDNQVRILVDGVPLEMSGFGLGTGSIPVEFLDRVEIYQGVVPIAFGADALGGAVNLVTRRRTLGTGGSLSLQVGSFGTYRLTGGVQHTFGKTGIYLKAFGAFDLTDNDYLVDVKVADSAGKPQPATVRRFHDGYRAGSGGLEAGVAGRSWADNLMLRFFGSRFDKQIQSNLTMDLAYGDVKSDRESWGLLLRYAVRFLGGRIALESNTGFADQRSDYQDLGTWVYDWFGQKGRMRSDPGEVSTGGSDRTTWTRSFYERLDLSWTVARGHTIELVLAPTYTTRDGIERRTLPGTADSLAIQRRMFKFIPGLAYRLQLFDRLENVAFGKAYVYLANAVDESVTGSPQVNASDVDVGFGDTARLVLWRGLAVKASYEHAMRLPQPEELLGDNINVRPNAHLRPEISDNVNVTLQYESGLTRAGRFNLEATGFFRFAKNLIALFAQNDTQLEYMNVVGATSKGLQGQAAWVSPGRHVSLGGNLTYMDYRYGALGQPAGPRIPNQPYFFANANARGTIRGTFSSSDELSLGAYMRYVHSFLLTVEGPGLLDTKPTVPQQLTFSAALVYTVPMGNRRFVSTLEIDNLADAKVYDFYGLQRPGRAVFWKGMVEFL